MIDLGTLLSGASLPHGVLLRGLPAPGASDGHLARQVMALANTDLEGPRCLVFGVEYGPGGALTTVGLADADLQRLRTQCQACADALEPALGLSILAGEFRGGRVAGLLVDGCENPPYVAGERAFEPLRAGECCLFDVTGLRVATRADLDGMYATRRQRTRQRLFVGLGDDPRCELLEARLPPLSDPPSRVAALKLRAVIAAKVAASVVMGRDDTAMSRLAHARIYGAEAPYKTQRLDALRRSLASVPDEYREADLRHRFERRAVRLNCAILNMTADVITDARFDLVIPDIAGLAVASSLMASAIGEDYPEVTRHKGCYRLSTVIAMLAPGDIVQAFREPARLSVEPQLANHKIAVRYAMRGARLDPAVTGRLRLRFIA